MKLNKIMRKDCKNCTYYLPVKDLYVSCSATDKVHSAGWSRKGVCKYYKKVTEKTPKSVVQLDNQDVVGVTLSSRR